MDSRTDLTGPSEKRFSVTSRCALGEDEGLGFQKSGGNRDRAHCGERAGEASILGGNEGEGTCMGSEWCKGPTDYAHVHVPLSGHANGGGNVGSGNVAGAGPSHMTSVEVKQEKIREEVMQGGLLVAGAAVGEQNAEGGCAVASSLHDGPMHLERMGGLEDLPPDGVTTGTGNMGEKNDFQTPPTECTPAPTVEEAARSLHGTPGGMGVKISKRTGKPVRKYERKAKKKSEDGTSGEGTGSFVGQVTAMIDTITRGVQDEVERGIMGDHIPEDSDVQPMGCRASEHASRGRGKRKLTQGPRQRGTAGSGNKEASAREVANFGEVNVNTMSTSPARRIRKGKTVAKERSSDVQHEGEVGEETQGRGKVLEAQGPSGRGAANPTHVAHETPGTNLGDSANDNVHINEQEVLDMDFAPYSPPATRRSVGRLGEPSRALRRCLFQMRSGTMTGARNTTFDRNRERTGTTLLRVQSCMSLISRIISFFVHIGSRC